MLLFEKNCPNCDTYYDSTLEQCPKCHKDNELYTQRDISDNVVFFHPLAQIGLFVGGFSYLGLLICGLFASFFFGGITNELLRNGLILFFSYLLLFGGLVSIVISTRRKTFFKKMSRPIDYVIGLGFAIALVLVSIVLDKIIGAINGDVINNNQLFAEELAINYPVLSGFIIILLGPICEELTYRVGLYSFLRRINIVLAFAVTTIVFALIHFDFEAANMTNELLALPSYITCGFLLTLAYELRGPACSMTAHMLYNLFAFIMIFADR